LYVFWGLDYQAATSLLQLLGAQVYPQQLHDIKHSKRIAQLEIRRIITRLWKLYVKVNFTI
jgi:hypothetical protein